MRSSKHLFKNYYSTIWIPQFDNECEIKEFIENEYELLENTVNQNSKKYYELYKKKLSICILKLVECSKKNNLSNSEFNKLMLCLIKYNNIGPEMYLTYSSILLIVWNFQMKNNIPIKYKKLLAPISAKENQLLFKKTKKEKYKNRLNVNIFVRNKILLFYLKIKVG